MSEFNKISELLDNTNLSNEELRELKYKIVGQLRLNQEVNTRTLRYKLREGTKVKINTPDGNRKHRGQVLEGEVTKVNRTTAIVEVDTMTYKVSLDLLELV